MSSVKILSATLTHGHCPKMGTKVWLLALLITVPQLGDCQSQGMQCQRYAL